MSRFRIECYHFGYVVVISVSGIAVSKSFKREQDAINYMSKLLKVGNK